MSKEQAKIKLVKNLLKKGIITLSDKVSIRRIEYNSPFYLTINGQKNIELEYNPIKNKLRIKKNEAHKTNHKNRHIQGSSSGRKTTSGNIQRKTFKGENRKLELKDIVTIRDRRK